MQRQLAFLLLVGSAEALAPLQPRRLQRRAGPRAASLVEKEGPPADLLGDGESGASFDSMASAPSLHVGDVSNEGDSGGTSLETSEGPHHLGIGALLKDYGVIALLFHFSVWVASIAATYSMLNVADTSTLPEAVKSFLPSAEIGAGAGPAQIAATLALVEAVGPFRIALTVAVTPSVSKVMRKFAFVRATESTILQAFASVKNSALALLPGKATKDDSGSSREAQ